jgi:hypothetical protein
MGANGQAEGNPLLLKQGIITFYDFYKQAFNREPSGAKYDALFLMNDISTKLQRGMFLPKGSPPAAVQALREAFQATGRDQAFADDFRKITGEEPDVVSPADVEAIFGRIRNVDPEVKRILRESIGQEG